MNEDLDTLIEAIRGHLGMVAEYQSVGDGRGVAGAIRKSSWGDGIEIYEGKFEILSRDGGGYLLKLPIGQTFIEIVSTSTEEAVALIKSHYEKYYSDLLNR